jgi:hypothetical protein
MGGEEGVGNKVLLFDFCESSEELGVVGFIEGLGHAGELRDRGESTVDFGRAEDLLVNDYPLGQE